jgi:hypothetical protein
MYSTYMLGDHIFVIETATHITVWRSVGEYLYGRAYPYDSMEDYESLCAVLQRELDPKYLQVA